MVEDDFFDRKLSYNYRARQRKTALAGEDGDDQLLLDLQDARRNPRLNIEETIKKNI